jgi:hypothetical protein
MSKLIPMACLALLGTAGHAWASAPGCDPAPAATSPNSTDLTTAAQIPVSKLRARAVPVAPDIQQLAVSGARVRGMGIRHEMKL